MNNFIGYLCLIIAFLTTSIDQITKATARAFIRNNIIRINSFLSFAYSENTGAAWSMFVGHSSILAILGIVSMVILGLIYEQLDTSFQKILAAMIFGGIFGNTLDRIFRGYVIDFISIDLKFYRWPVFNIADSIICVGIVILLFTFRQKVQEAR
ncbi:MAG: signal peptidase II [Puniceicoccales bacterium]|jgi:signal peptidase II|nr:signal peptidase II [Puniceicoccales bacterium]